MRWIGIMEMKDTGKKTKDWWVYTKKDGDSLGYIRWFARWRKYCFFPNEDTVFEWDCLRYIANFIEEETKKHK